MKICLISQFPPPVHGLSKAVDTLYRSTLKDKYGFSSIDITNNRRFLSNALKIFFDRSDIYYFTISQSIGGNLRDLIIFFLLCLKRRKIVIHLHGGYYRSLIENDCGLVQRRLNYFFLKRVSCAIVLSKLLSRNFTGLVDSSKIYSVANCVDDEFLLSRYRFNLKNELLFCKRKLNVLYLSNFIESKGYKEVLQLALLAKEHLSNFEFHFAGRFYSVQDENYFNEFVKGNSLEEFVFYHGIVNGVAKQKLLEYCDIFILLTNYANEGQPISILEAMGNGLAIVSTNHAGIPDIVANIVNGIVVDKNRFSLNDILYYLVDLDTNRHKLSVMSKNNYYSILSNYTQKHYVDNIDRIFGLLG